MPAVAILPAFDSPEAVLACPHVAEAMARRLIQLGPGKITYNLNNRRTYNWNAPEVRTPFAPRWPCSTAADSALYDGGG